MKILKFGGTSVGSAKAFQETLNVIQREYNIDNQIIVVCSAMSGITNLLQKMALNASIGENFIDDLKLIEQKHKEVVHTLLSPTFQNEVLIELQILFNEIEVLLEGISAVQEVSSKTNDRILAYGELCNNLMTAHLINHKISKAIFTDSRPLIKTDSNFGNARVNTEITNQNIQNWYQNIKEKTIIPVVTGFIAGNEKNITTTLGRGGSDYTAALLGSALQCQEIQIWTDVDGFMTADPRIVPHAVSLDELSYSEAMELSYFGAKVIYPPTMIPAIEKQIPIRIKNTFNQTYPGTLIHHIGSEGNSLARGVATINDVSLVNIEGSGMVGFKGFSGRLFSALAQKEVNVIMITQAGSEHSISFAVEKKDIERVQIAISREFEYELLTHKIDAISVENEVSIVAVVGENMRNSQGMAGKMFYALGRVGVNIIAIAQGSSELNISAVIKKSCVARAVNAIHNDLFLASTINAHLVVVGVGNIGKTLMSQIKNQKDYLLKNQDLQLKLVAIANSQKKLIDISGIDYEHWENQLVKTDAVTSLEKFIQNVKEINLPNIVFVDNTSSNEVSQYYHTLLSHNISVVTCNKIATSSAQKNYDLLKQIALKKNVHFLYETNVGAGLPIIKTLQDLKHSGDKIIKVEAILSGTISFIFNNYKGDATFAAIVKEAQDRGYTEPNPADDLSGKDFARKMLILARESGLVLELEDIEIFPILPKEVLATQTTADFYDQLQKAEPHFEALKKQAQDQNAVLRYVGVLENGKASIKIEMLTNEHPFYSLSGSDNIISITTQRYLHNPLVIKGPGAGAEVTAAGVFAEIIRVASYY